MSLGWRASLLHHRGVATDGSWPLGALEGDVPAVPATGEPDPREPMEAHRLLHTLAAHDGRERCEAWLRAFPTGRGLGWRSTVDVAARIVPLGWFGLFGAVAAHADWLLTQPSVGSSLGNHRVAELGGLALAAACIPRHPRASRWAREASKLPAVLDELVEPDGEGRERSTHYLAFSLEWALVAAACGVSGCEPALRRAMAFLAALTDGDHTLAFGDSDSACVLPGPVGEFYVPSVLSAVAGWLGEPPGGVGRSGFPGGVPQSTQARFAGVSTLRSSPWLVALDHGPLGLRPLGSHGHADALGLRVMAHGLPLVGNRGTPGYQHPLRKQKRSAHSQATIELPTAWAKPGPTFLWERWPSLQPRKHPGVGIGATLGPVARHVTLGDAVVIEDTVRLTRAAPVRWSLPFHPRWRPDGCSVTDGSHRIQIGYNVEARWVSEQHALAYGELCEAFTLELETIAPAGTSTFVLRLETL